MSFSPLPPVGQAAMAASLPVVIASNQSAVPVSGTFYQATQPVSLASVPSHAVTNAGTFAVQVDNTVTVASHAVTNAGTFAVQESGIHLLVDDNAFTPATSKVSMAGFTFDDVAPDSVNEGDAGAARMSANRNIYVTLRDAAGNERGLNVDSSGQIAVTIASVPSHAVTNAGTFAVQESGTHVQVDDAAFTPATSKVLMAGAEYDDTTPDSVDEGDGGAIRMSANRNLYVRIRDNAGNERGLNVDASGQIAVTLASGQTLGTVTTVSTVTAFGTGTTGPMKAEDAAHANGDQGLAVWAVRLDTPVSGANASGSADYVPFITDSFGKLWTADVQTEDVAHASGERGSFSLAVANEAQTSLAADGDYIGFATDVKGNQLSVGNIAHDGVDAGRPMKVGGRARSTEITAVASDDRVDAIFDLVGKQIILPYSNPENFVSGAITTAMTGTTSTSLVAAPAAGLRNYITTIVCSNAHATVGTDIVIQDGSGGTTLMTIPAAAVYGGAVINLPVPLRQPTTATAIYCANVTTGASTKVSAVGYKGA